MYCNNDLKKSIAVRIAILFLPISIACCCSQSRIREW